MDHESSPETESIHKVRLPSFSTLAQLQSTSLPPVGPSLRARHCSGGDSQDIARHSGGGPEGTRRKAQQVAVAKVAPLRVNLPTRGVRYSFAQVLQTELRKPMTICLLAENTKVPSWTSRIGLSVLGFGVLWLIVAGLNRRQRAQV